MAMQNTCGQRRHYITRSSSYYLYINCTATLLLRTIIQNEETINNESILLFSHFNLQLFNKQLLINAIEV